MIRTIQHNLVLIGSMLFLLAICASVSASQHETSVRQATLSSHFCWGWRVTVGATFTVGDFALSEYRCTGEPGEAVWRKDPSGWKSLRYGSQNDVWTLVRAGVPRHIAQELIDKRFLQTSY